MTRYDEIIREHLPRYRRTHKAIKNLKDHGDTGENDVIDDLLHVIDCQQALIERLRGRLEDVDAELSEIGPEQALAEKEGR